MFILLFSLEIILIYCPAPNGLRYLRWGGDGEAVQPEKGYGVENCLKCAQNPQRQVHALLGVFDLCKTQYLNMKVLQID